MTNKPVSSTMSADALRKLEKEARHESKSVDQAARDLQSAEKAEATMKKVVEKADHRLRESEGKEASASKVMGKAERKYDDALANMRAASSDARKKHEQHMRLQHDIETKKVQVDNAIQRKNAKENDLERERARAVV